MSNQKQSSNSSDKSANDSYAPEAHEQSGVLRPLAQDSKHSPTQNSPAQTRVSQTGISQSAIEKHYRHSLSTQRLPILAPKLLLHVLGPNESRDDLIKKPKSIALNNQTDVYIARAELELRKVVQSLALISNIDANSLHTLAALSLPGSSAAMLWTSSAFVQTKHQNIDDQGLIRHRNHDARLLFQHIARLNLKPWADQLINQVKLNELPEDIFMPPGHPIPGETYRRHPFQQRQNFYYPASQFFSMLFEERQQALTALLGELGATKISISPPPGESLCDGGSSPIAQLYERIFEYPQTNQPLPKTINIQKHPWLSCEPKWQAVVRERLSRGILSTQFEFGVDIVGILNKQIQVIEQLVPQLDSMTLSARSKTELLLQVVQPRRVRVEFGKAEFGKTAADKSQ
ncbi:MAG: hypothetical protein WA947_19000 [Phormidesmis sp.]